MNYFDRYHLFVAAHTLMDEAVQPLLGRPVLTRADEPSKIFDFPNGDLAKYFSFPMS